jgi:hypothetical protein
MQTVESNDYVMLGLLNVYVMPYGFQALPLINSMTTTITCSFEEKDAEDISGLICLGQC